MSRYIVLVEKDPKNALQFTRAIKTAANLPVVELEDSRELLLFLEDQRDGDLPSLVIMDKSLSGITGLETSSLLKRDYQFRSVLVVILATAITDRDVELCFEAGIKLFEKPTSFEQWQDLCAHLLHYCV